MPIRYKTINVTLLAAAILVSNALYAAPPARDVNVINAPDVNVANVPDVVVANTVGNPVPVSVVANDNGPKHYQNRFQIQMTPQGSVLTGAMDIDQTIPTDMILKVKAVNFGSASSTGAAEPSIEVKLQNVVPLTRQTFISNLSEPNGAGIRVRGHYLTEFLIRKVQSDIHDNIEVAIQNVVLVDTVLEITLTGELLPATSLSP